LLAACGGEQQVASSPTHSSTTAAFDAQVESQRIVDLFTAYRRTLLDQDGPRAATLDGRRHWTVPEQWFWSAALGGSAGPAIGWMVVSTQAGS